MAELAGIIDLGFYRRRRKRGGFARTLSGALLASETDGLAFVSTDTAVSDFGSLTIKDTVTPANSYSGHPFTFGGGKLTHARASTKRQLNASGLWEEVAIDRPAVYRDPVTLINYGYWPEESRINAALWSDDLTNAAWTKTNCTAAKTATGADGVTNSATTLTATAANGFAIQNITAASAQRVTSIAVKRRTGTGAVTLSQGETTGSNLVTNGTFATNDFTGWTTHNSGTGTSSAATGAAVLVGTDALNRGIISQVFTTVAGKIYQITTPATYTSGGITLAASTASGQSASLASAFFNAGTPVLYFAASGTTSYVNIYTGPGGGNVSIDNVSVFEVVETTLSLTSSWQRLPTAAATITNPALIIKLATSGDEIDVMYVQCEAGSFMTSPIPTTSAAVTRAADTCSIATTLFNHSASANTLYVDFLGAQGSSPMLLVTRGAAATDCNQIYRSSGNFINNTVVASVNRANISIAGATSGAHKVAYAYATNDYQACRDGTLGTADLSGSLPTVTTLEIGGRVNALQANGPISTAMHLPRRMSNAELQTLTA